LSISLYSPSLIAQDKPADRGDIAATSRVLEQLSAQLAPAVVEIEVRAWEVSDSKEDPNRAAERGSSVSDSKLAEIVAQYAANAPSRSEVAPIARPVNGPVTDSVAKPVTVAKSTASYPPELESLVQSGLASYQDGYWLVKRCEKCGQFKNECCGRVFNVSAVRRDDQTLTRFGRQAVGLDPVTPPKPPKSQEQILQEKMADMQKQQWWTAFRGVGELEGNGTVKMYIENFLPEGVTLISGLPKEGKSWLALAIAKALTTGEPLFGQRGYEVPEIIPVLYLAAESGDGALKLRCKRFGITEDKTKFIARTLSQGPMFGLDRPEIESAIRALRPAIVLETLIRFNDGSDEDDATENRKLAEAIFRLIGLGARAVIGIHHSRKDLNKANPTKEAAVRGSGDGLAMVDAVWLVMQDERLFQAGKGPNEIDVVGWGRDFNPRPMRLALTKKAPKDLPPGVITFAPGIVSCIDFGSNLEWVDKRERVQQAKAEQQDLAQLVERLITETPSIGRKELADKVGVSEWQVRGVLKRLGYQRKKGGKEAGDWEKPDHGVVH
jgi:hypothetical protein